MKKYLFNGAMALIVGAFIVSCSHDDIGQTSTVEQMTKSFDEMFKELYGPIAPNHNWGFRTVAAELEEDETTETEAAGTRTAYTNSNMWSQDGLTEPEPISKREKEVVMKWFRENENPRSETVEMYNYFIQNVGYTDHTYHAYYQKDGRTEEVTITNPATNNMDYIFVGAGYYWNGSEPARITWDNGDDHVNNFNAGSGDIQYIKYSGSDYFGFHDSYGTGYSTPGHGNNGKYCEKNRNFVIRFIEVDGVVGCYVGFNYESGKTSEGWHLEPDGFFDDRVIKLVASNTTPSTQERDEWYRETKSIKRITYREIVDLGRVFCEDIATAKMQVQDDVDYNDIVFDARVWEIYDLDETTINGGTPTKSDKKKHIKYQYDISMLAAGGTIQANVGINTEVHDAFGVSHTFMVNTWTPNSKAFGQYNTPTNVMYPKDEIISYTLDYNDPKLDPDDVGISSIPIDILYKDGYEHVKIALKNNNGIEQESMDENGKKIYTSNAPFKICVPIGTSWPIERVNIRDAYNDFSKYVQNGDVEFYYGSTGENKLYEAPTSKIQSDGWNIGYKEEISSSTKSSEFDVVWKGNISADTDRTDITLYNYEFTADMKLRFYGSGTIRVLDNSNQVVFESIPMPGSGGYYDINIKGSQALSLNGGTIIINGSNFSLTKIVVVKKDEY